MLNLQSQTVELQKLQLVLEKNRHSRFSHFHNISCHLYRTNPSLLDQPITDDSTTSTVLRIVTCPIVKETLISPHPSFQPVSHWLCGVLPLSSGREPHTILLSLKHTVLQALSNVISSTVLQSSSCDEIQVSVAGDKTTLVKFHSYTHKSSLTDPQCSVEVESEPTHLVFTVHLDTLALVAHDIPHISLLWSQDRRFMEQFNKLEEDSKHITFRPFSLFAPNYTHDISFWLLPQLSASRDESEIREMMDREMCRAVRCVAGFRALRVSHVETYRCEAGEGGGGRVSVETGECEVGEGGGGRVSMCYI